jgi:hypothetical protein
MKRTRSGDGTDNRLESQVQTSLHPQEKEILKEYCYEIYDLFVFMK